MLLSLTTYIPFLVQSAFIARWFRSRGDEVATTSAGRVVLGTTTLWCVILAHRLLVVQTLVDCGSRVATIGVVRDASFRLLLNLPYLVEYTLITVEDSVPQVGQPIC